MLDKSIAYKDVFMKATPDVVAKATHPTLPTGYTIRYWMPGDESHWAWIETAVDEFSSIEKASAYYDGEFGPYPEEMAKRCVFVLDPDGVPVATATAWTHLNKIGDRPTVHWVSALPSEQGKGLGQAVVQEVMTIFAVLHPGEEVWLHTQTWSHKAMCLYHKLGFGVAKPDAATVEAFQYDPEAAFAILEPVMDPKRLNALKESVF